MTHTYLENTPSRMGKNDFVSIFGSVYEHSKWIAEEAWELGSDPQSINDRDTAEGIQAIFRKILDQAGDEAKLRLLRAHPDLAGKLAVSGNLTNASKSEQSGANLDNCSPEELDEFQTLNYQYKEKFGFPFILAVRGYQRTEILQMFRQRIKNDWATEFETALDQVHRIALLRLRDIR